LLADHIGSDDSDDGVPQPIGSSRQGNTSRSDGKWEDLANNNPCSRTPGRRKEENENGDKCDLSVHGGDVVCYAVGGVVESNGDTNDSDEELADQHSESAIDQDRTTTKSFNGPERQRGRANVDEGENEGDQEHIADCTGGLKEDGGVVEDEIDSSPLLHLLQRCPQDGTAQV